MAERQEMLGLTAVTQCLLCTKEFTQPRVLDCIHTFCLKCLVEYVQQQGKTCGQRFQCPVCSKSHVIPDGGIEDLPKNIFMEHLLEISHLEAADQTDIACQVCDLEDDIPSHAANSNRATVYCLDCRQYHCARCSKHHMKQRFSQSHEMVELGKRISADMIKRVKTFCDQHKDKQVEFYCYDCRVTFCMSCYVVKHNRHRSCDISEISEQFYRNVEEDIGRVGKTAKDCTKEEVHLKTVEEEFRRGVDDIKTQIRNDAEMLRRYIDEEEQRLLEDLQKIQEANLERIRKRMREIHQYISMLDNFKRYIIEVKDKATPADVSRIGCSLHERANELHIIPYDVDFALDTISYAKDPFPQFNNHQKNAIGSVSLVSKVVDGHCQQAGEPSGQNRDNGDDSIPASQEPQPCCSGVADVRIKEEPMDSVSDAPTQSGLLKVVRSVLKGREIQGITEVKGALYVVRKRREGISESPDIEVYDLTTFSASLGIAVPGIGIPVDMTSCAHSSCLYVSDSGNNCVHKIVLGSVGNKRWPVDEQPGCLSVNHVRNVLVTCSQAHLVKEYSADGVLIRKVSFGDSGLYFPIHAIQLESGLLAVCHGCDSDAKYRVCITDVSGAVVESFCRFGSSELLRPTYLSAFHDEFLFVSDGGNRRILLLKVATLECHRNVLSESDAVRNPFRLLFVNDTLYVVSNYKSEGRVLVCEYAK